MQFNCFRFQHTHLITGLLKVFSAVGGDARVWMGNTYIYTKSHESSLGIHCLRVA